MDHQQPPHDAAPALTSRIELNISCTELINMDVFSKSDPQVIMYVHDRNGWREYGRTEIIWDNLSPKFVKSFVVDYYFESMLVFWPVTIF